MYQYIKYYFQIHYHYEIMLIMNTTNSLTKKQILLLSITLITLMFGAMLWVLAIDQPSRIVGGALIGLGLASIIPFAILQDKVAADRRSLKSKGRRVDAHIEEVVDDGGVRGVYFYYLKLADPNNSNVKFESDPLSGNAHDAEAIRSLIDYARQIGKEDYIKIPVYVDLKDETHYFVDIPYNFGHSYAQRIRDVSSRSV